MQFPCLEQTLAEGLWNIRFLKETRKNVPSEAFQAKIRTRANVVVAA